ncbi:hypothetical protein POM88_047295 [Heracleum sosnowskyi]|uniref:Uncharacterized protein n=1 Tax=Heracleum sosnowskyi TaxID=360622 RepID=A0AAD8GT78_9APIA|nr:hypothetical protein POM88_047295 [Heracleum sosnowskyi]
MDDQGQYYRRLRDWLSKLDWWVSILVIRDSRRLSDWLSGLDFWAGIYAQLYCILSFILRGLMEEMVGGWCFALLTVAVISFMTLYASHHTCHDVLLLFVGQYYRRLRDWLSRLDWWVSILVIRHSTRLSDWLSGLDFWAGIYAHLYCILSFIVRGLMEEMVGGWCFALLTVAVISFMTLYASHHTCHEVSSALCGHEFLHSVLDYAHGEILGSIVSVVAGTICLIIIGQYYRRLRDWLSRLDWWVSILVIRHSTRLSDWLSGLDFWAGIYAHLYCILSFIVRGLMEEMVGGWCFALLTVAVISFMTLYASHHTCHEVSSALCGHEFLHSVLDYAHGEILGSIVSVVAGTICLIIIGTLWSVLEGEKKERPHV